MVRAEDAGEVSRVHADGLAQLRERDAVADSPAQQLLHLAQPERRPRAGDDWRPSLPTGGGEQLERQAFGGERRRRIGCSQFARQAPGQPAEAGPRRPVRRSRQRVVGSDALLCPTTTIRAPRAPKRA